MQRQIDPKARASNLPAPRPNRMFSALTALYADIDYVMAPVSAFSIAGREPHRGFFKCRGVHSAGSEAECEFRGYSGCVQIHFER
jgi:hypothetical protein